MSLWVRTELNIMCVSKRLYVNESSRHPQTSISYKEVLIWYVTTISHDVMEVFYFCWRAVIQFLASVSSKARTQWSLDMSHVCGIVSDVGISSLIMPRVTCVG